LPLSVAILAQAESLVVAAGAACLPRGSSAIDTATPPQSSDWSGFMPDLPVECLRGILMALNAFATVMRGRLTEARQKRTAADHTVRQLELALEWAKEHLASAATDVEVAQSDLRHLNHKLAVVQWAIDRDAGWQAAMPQLADEEWPMEDQEGS